MSPRPYRMEKRRIAASETRQRILEAARELLTEHVAPDLSMDAIARRADVARLTIYYQFKSRRGLLEALYDHLAMRGNMQRMAEVFQTADASHALELLVRTFVGFWSSDPIVMRRLRAMAALDVDIEKGIEARDARRQHAARQILGRMAAGRELKKDAPPAAARADVLSALTSFEMYDALNKAGHPPEEIVAVISHLARSAIETYSKGSAEAPAINSPTGARKSECRPPNARRRRRLR